MDVEVKKLCARNQHDMKVFEWFKVHVIESKLDVSIDNQELVSYLYFIYVEFQFISSYIVLDLLIIIWY